MYEGDTKIDIKQIMQTNPDPETQETKYGDELKTRRTKTYTKNKKKRSNKGNKEEKE